MGVLTPSTCPNPGTLPPFFSAGLRDLRFPLRDLRGPTCKNLAPDNTAGIPTNPGERERQMLARAWFVSEYPPECGNSYSSQ